MFVFKASFLGKCYSLNMKKLNTFDTITLERNKVVAHHNILFKILESKT